MVVGHYLAAQIGPGEAVRRRSLAVGRYSRLVRTGWLGPAGTGSDGPEPAG